MAGTSYTRQSTLTDGDTITASLFNTEYNQLVSAFAYASTGTTGHQHDGGAGEGGNIHTIGDQDFNNKIVVDSSNNRWSVYVEVGGSAVEQVRIEDGVVYPVTDSDVDLGTNVLRFKDAYIDSLTATGNLTIGGNIDVDGTIEFDGLSGTGSVTVTDILDQDDMSGNSATALATQQSIKAYVDAQVTAQDLDLTDGSSSISIDLDSEALSILGGTGIDSTASGNGVTLAIDSTVTTLTGSQTLTNKTLTSPDVNTPDIDGGTIDGTVIGGSSAAAGSFTTVGATGNITVGGTVDGRDVATDGTKLDGIEASATADQTASEIRTLVESASDSNVFTDADHTKLNAIEASADVTDTTNVTAAGALMDSELTSIASVKALNQGVATTDSPTFAAVTVNGNVEFDGLSGTGSVTVTDILDQDDMSGNSATALATQQSIKAYVDAQQDTVDTLAEILALSNATGGTDIAVGTGDDITFADNSKAIFGSGSDLQIYHDGSASYIDDAGTGNLRIRANGSLSIQKYTGETLGVFTADGSVLLAHDNSTRLETTTSGISVTGEVAATSLDISGDIDVDGTTNLDVVDIDGAVDMASGLTVSGVTALTHSGVTLSVDRTGGNTALIELKQAGTVRSYLGGDSSKSFIVFNESAAERFSITSAGAATFAGAVTANAGVTSSGTGTFGILNVDDISINNASITSTGGITLDATSNIVFDAGGANFYLKDDGTTFGQIIHESPNFTIKSTVSDGDLLFKGNDGGSTILALKLDMSDAGTAVFNHHVKLSATSRLFFDGGSNTYIQESASDDLRFFVGGSQAVRVRASGTDILGTVTADAITVDNITIDGNEIDVGSGDLTLDVAGDIELDAGGGDFIFKDDGTSIFLINHSSSDVQLTSMVNNKDIIFRGNDGGSFITALTLDMSNGGSATFNKDILMGDGNPIRLGDSQDLRIFYSGGSIFQDTTSDSDMFFKGNDGGSTITALSLDMSAAGAATFNSTIAATSATFTTADNSAQLTLVSTDTDASVGPRLGLYRNSSSPANGDVIGEIQFQAKDTVNSTTTFATISSQADQVDNGAEDGSLRFKTLHNGTLAERITIAQNNHVIINETGVDADFRVESSGNDHMLFVDGGNNKVGFNNSSLTNTGLVQMHGTYAATNTADYRDNNVLTLTGNDPGTTADDSGINLAFVPVVGRGSAGVIAVETTGTNKEGGGQMRFFTGGSSYPTTLDEKMQLNHNNGVIFNETGGDMDFRVESDSNTHMLFVDAGNNHVNINTSSDLGGVLNVAGDLYFDASREMRWQSNTFKIGSTGAIGVLELAADSSSTFNSRFDITNTDGNLVHRIDGGGGARFNEQGANADFRVESDSNTHMLFVDGGNNRVGIGATSIDGNSLALSLGNRTGSVLNYINGTANTISTATGMFVSATTTNESTVSYGLQLANNSNVADTRSPLIGFSALSASGSYNHTYGAIWGMKSGNGADTNWNTGQLHFGTSDGTGVDTRMKLSQVGGLITTPASNGHAVFNEDSADADFRVESSGNDHMLFVDGGNNRVGVGTSSPGSLLELEATEATVFDETVTDGQAGNGSTLAIQNLSDTNNTFSQLLFRNRATSKAVSRIASLTDSTGTKMAFVVENNGSPAEVLRLEKTGNVSIPNGSLTFGANGEGRIRVVNTNNMVIESTTADHSGLQFGTHTITPHEASASSDGTIDVGTTTARFRNLYLSEGVFLGGTGSANKLDDYEEGTWTPVMGGSGSGLATFTASRANYVKIGTQVTVYAYLTNVDVSGSFSGNFQIGSLPFSSSSGNNFCQSVVVTFATIFNTSSLNPATTNLSGYITGTTIQFYQGSSSTTVPTSALTGTGKVIMVSATYLAD